MNRSEMIQHINNNCLTWGEVYIDFQRFDGEIRARHGWYMAFDGPKLSDVYLTNKHPMSDESGEVITIGDFNG
jgi:hypothetical protein